MNKSSKKSKSKIPIRAARSPSVSLWNSRVSSANNSKLPSKTASPIKLVPLEPLVSFNKRQATNYTDIDVDTLTRRKAAFGLVQMGRSNHTDTLRQPGFDQTVWNDIVCVEDYFPRVAVTTPIDLLSEKLLKRIFSYVNHTDLLICCCVQRYWHHVITSDPVFLERTLCVISINKLHPEDPTDSTVNSNADLTLQTKVPFRHARLQNVDPHYLENPSYFEYMNSDNHLYFPDERFLSCLKTLELRSSFILWNTVKRIMVQAVNLESLKFNDCHVSDNLPPDLLRNDEFYEFRAGNAVVSMRKLEIYEARQLKGISIILKKFTGYRNQKLEGLKISYHPPANPNLKRYKDTEDDSVEFCEELKKLLKLCADTLQSLILDIRDEPALNLLGDHLSKLLPELSHRMNLKEYQLNLNLGCWEGAPESMPKTNVTMKMDSWKKSPLESEQSVTAATIAIALFLASQKNLEKLALPCIAYPEIYSPEFKVNFSKLPCANKLNFLSVPSAGFLLPEFLEEFPRLRRIKVGGSCCSDYTSGWEIFKLYLLAKEKSSTGSGSGMRGPLSLKSQSQISQSHQARSNTLMRNDFFNVVEKRSRSRHRNEYENNNFDEKRPIMNKSNDTPVQVMSRIEELCISSCSMPNNFPLVIHNLSGLTLLEISCPLAIFTDEHMQTVIKQLRQLRTLMIGCADLLTDFGITGIPEEYCMLKFRLQRYLREGMNLDIWEKKKLSGRPISDLKGLRKLVLIGNSKITDVGIGYGLIFQELKYCHLPYSDYFMAWGIQRFGEMNPSLETLILSGVNQNSKDAFLQLRKSHSRLKRGDITRSGYFVEKESPVNDDFTLMLYPPPKYLTQLYGTVRCKISEIINYILESIRGIRSS